MKTLRTGLLLAPGIAVLVIFGIGFVRLLGVSLGFGRPGAEVGFTGYLEFATSETNLLILGRTFRAAIITTLISILVAYPIAYVIARMRSVSLKLTMLAVSLAPWLISLVVSTYGWSVLLAPSGAVNSALLGLGIIQEPLPLLYNSFSVIVGMVHVFVPFMILSIYT